MTQPTHSRKPTKANTPKSSSTTKKPEETNDSPALFADINVNMKSGHLVKDSELVGQDKFVKFRFASNKQYEDQSGEVKTNTNYFDVLISSSLTEAFELAKGFKKGDWVYVKGEDSTRSFDTPEGYKKMASTIFAYHVALKKQQAPSQQESLDIQ